MAVYTPLTKQEIEAFLARYDVGELSSFKGIAEGIENTNYLISLSHRERVAAEGGRVREVPHTGRHSLLLRPHLGPLPEGEGVKYILTLFEQRVNPKEVP